ncbi:MAG: cation-translocating P-type ATPase [Chloroflexota bacterium]
MSAPIYALRVSDVYTALETCPEGLSVAEAQQRVALYGQNVITEPPESPAWVKLLAQINHPMAWLLLLAGLIALFVGQPGLWLVIWGVVLTNVAFSYWQEFRASRAVSALREMLPPQARVLRDGEEVYLSANELVPGDVLVLAEGDNIPADARVVEEYGLRANNASLTGEAMPARKTADASLREGLTEVERPNLVFAGTSIFSGTGKAVVYATGMLTQFGRIANLTQAVREEPSLLMEDMKRVTRKITFVALAIGAAVFFTSVLDAGMNQLEALILAIGLIVAVIPEGLIPTVTLTLSKAVQRLARQDVLVKKMAVVETLGTTSIICTDKSGTLTQNQMTVSEVWAGGHRFHVSGIGYEPNGALISLDGEAHLADVQAIMEACLMCNNARLNPPTAVNDRWTSLGDQTEVALRVLALKGGLNQLAVARALPRAHELPFDARRKRMSTIHWSEGQQTVFVKGAPKEVLQLCTHIYVNGEVRPLDNELRAQALAANDEYARHALRVLALARRSLPPRSGPYVVEEIERDLTFLGLAAMMDPPRTDVAEAVQSFHKAGIRMVMITGDYGLTAESMARRVGMLVSAHPRIVTGAELDELEDFQLQEMLGEEVIFARMAPEHKLRLVAAYQARGEVVAVIGDGVNDAPALRKADVGIAMGYTGTDVAKEAADVILTRDNFRAVSLAIMEGRAVYDNLRKFITYIFTSNVPEVLPFLAMALFHIPLALTVPQILAIDLGTDLLPALALGAERPEPGVMERAPRPRYKPLLDRSIVLRSFFWLGLIETILCYLAFYYVLYSNGYANLLEFPRVDWLPYRERLTSHAGLVYVMATTVFHAGVVMAQIGNAYACRTERGHVRYLGLLKNRTLIIGVLAEVSLILALIYVPPLARLFEHYPFPAEYWIVLACFGPLLYVLDWLRREIFRRLKK